MSIILTSCPLVLVYPKFSTAKNKAITRSCSKLIDVNFTIFQEKTCYGVFSYQTNRTTACNCLKKGIIVRCSLQNFMKFIGEEFRTPLNNYLLQASSLLNLRKQV